MNANELAVELEHYLKGEEYDRLVWEAPTMLRQQQAEIEALKPYKENYDAHFRKAIGEHLVKEVFKNDDNGGVPLIKEN